MRLLRAAAIGVVLVPLGACAEPAGRSSPYGSLIRQIQPEVFDPTYVISYRLFTLGSKQAIMKPVAGAVLKSPADHGDQTGSIYSPAPHR